MRLTSVALLFGVGACALACGRVPLDLGPLGSGGSSVAGATGLGGSGASTGSGGTAGRVPPNHRSTATACPVVTPPSGAPAMCISANYGSPQLCLTDGDCTTGKDGRCQGNIVFGGCTCSYDECFSDGDCASGEACACSGYYSGNTCVSVACHVDADCGVGGYCSPVVDACSMATTSYACHRPGDPCVADADCGDRSCAFDQMSRRWACVPAASCPQ